MDRMSIPYLNGATIDFADTIEKQGFTIDNPNAVGSCRLRRVLPLKPPAIPLVIAADGGGIAR